MKTFTHGRYGGLIRGLFIFPLLTWSYIPTASASLGGSTGSVQADQVHFKANIRVSENAIYAVHELRTPTDIVVREYISGGRVFAITWRGPFVPDMRQILGAYYQPYATMANAERERHVGRVPLNIQLPTLVLQTGGHMGAYFGRAYDPELLPAGIASDDIR